MSAFVLMVTNNEMSLFVFATMFGLSFGGRTILEVPVANRFFGLLHLSVILAILETAFGISGFIGPYLAGYVVDLTGRYYELFLLCILLSIVSCVITIPLRSLEDLT
jgi:MFS family permease